ncbi:MAG: hypothetical protein ACTSVW_04900 [Candidatus Njordarchaeales archaeon]
MNGYFEPWTYEHLKNVYPTKEEILKIFPNAKIKGYKNIDVRLKMKIIPKNLLLGLFSGVYYNIFLKSKNKLPPFYSAVIVVRK